MSTMISLIKLRQADASLRIKSKFNDSDEFAKLCSVDSLQDASLVLVKDSTYFNKFVTSFTQRDQSWRLAVIFQDSFFNSSTEVQRWEGLDKLSVYGTVKSVDLALAYFSALFEESIANQRYFLKAGQQNNSCDIHPSAMVADDVFLGENVVVEEDCVIHSGCTILANSRIGKATVLFPHVAIYQNVKIGSGCRIHANTTIGSDGFTYSYSDGQHHKTWHTGGVSIGENVEIGANCTIDQGTLSPTCIGNGTKIDNQVHIGHNCRVGKGVIICGQSGLAGSVTIGDFVIIAGAVNIAPGVRVGHQARLGGMSGVTGHVPDNADYAGHPARPVKEWLRAQGKLRRISLRPSKSTDVSPSP